MLKRLTPGVFLLAASGLLPLGTTYASSNSCYWGTGQGPIQYTVDVGALFVPRDAQVGDPIGPVDKLFVSRNSRSAIFCENDGTVILRFNARSAGATVAGPISLKSGMTTGALLQTNISGVGALISFGSPYDGLNPGLWKLDGPDSSVPFNAHIDFYTPFPIQHNLLRGTITLIKTGEIDPGMQTLDSGKELVKGSFNDIPDAFGVALSGSVTRAECTLSANPVSADPVKLGDWPNTEFIGEGHTSDAVPFTIALNACISDKPGGTVTHAHIRLEPTAGAVTLDASLGLMSLMPGSTAQGIGIQILGRDALTPVTLETDVLQGAIPATGGMMLQFNARYYQTAPANAIVAGAADGALGFTITYK
ncbi:fimbrial protein [Pseudomonas sp. TMW22091]|uniref:fimbrial protein n=1 Tax=Pseudomonas sp. TMW22091 TaxID=2506435 RepID=UPI001F0EF7D0|nr:fimbrial protein [Pseudomonas sp. TMW22091]